MIQTGFEKRVKVQQIIENQLPEFILSESPKAVDFLKQYYTSQEFQGGPTDLSNNLDQYLKLDNLTTEVISSETTLTSAVTSTEDVVYVASTKGFPNEYGLFKIDDEIITYTGITDNSFTGCVRGFSGITAYESELNPEELVFNTSSASSHDSGSTVKNLSSGFLKEFYNKLKYTYTPGLENIDFVSDLDVNNFIKESKSFYQSKGTEESYKILFKVLYGVNPTIVDLEDYLVKPSSANFRRREVVIAERISGDPNNLVGQSIKKSTDSRTQASVSEVEIFSRSGYGTYYKIGLFVGFDDKDIIEGVFNVQAQTKVINPVSIGDSVITVDSTIGFPSSGTIISGSNTIKYTSKTVNQFLGCSGVTSDIASASSLRVDEVFVGYEDGDVSKKVEIRITGVLSKFEATSDILSAVENEKIYTKNVGVKILNPDTNKTYKQLFANSLVYNTSSRFEVELASGSSVKLKTNIDKSSLKVGDKVDILSGSTETVLHSNAVVSTIDQSTRSITLNNLNPFQFDSNSIYSIRRKLNTASSSGTPILYGNDTITSDVQNFYVDPYGYGYIASNSLPSYEITETVLKSSISSAAGNTLQGYNSSTEKYSIISFDSDVPFITGDEVYYTASSNALNGLQEGSYYVRVLNPKNKIKLYASRSLIIGDTPVEFTSGGSGSHTFTLASQKSGEINPQKLLKKFPLTQNIKNGNNVVTTPGSTGMLVDGVEIFNYKSNDKVYYGPLEKVIIYNGGSNYDVVSPPEVTISSPNTGTTALVSPVINGNIKEVKVDPQNFDLVDVSSVTLSGGNGSGAILQPVLEKRNREIEFDARLHTVFGGVNASADTITFLEDHNLRDGDALVYRNNGNTSIGIGTYGGSNNDQGLTLGNDSVYYAKIVDTNTIRLHNSYNDYYSGINTVGFTTASSQGIHKFRLFNSKNTLKSIKVINPGSGYEYRSLKIKSTNISLTEDMISFTNHGFVDGDVVVYTAGDSAVGGLTNSTQYRVLKVDDNSFKLASSTNNFIKRLPVNLTSSGSGYQTFSYPDIELEINAEYDGVVGIITATPIIRGEIVDLYLYETGTGYGSTVLNFHNKPTVSIKTGKDAELKAFITNGAITSVNVTNGGSDYTSAPDLSVSGDGIGAKLRAIVSNNKIVKVVVLNSGIGYSQNTTSISITPAGQNGYVDANVRSLSLNNHYRFGDESLLDIGNDLEYGFIGYSTSIGSSTYSDDGTKHSPIIGWAYDGNPIYGAYGYTDPNDIDSQIKILSTGYSLSTSNITDRPSGFGAGFFVEDYKFVGSKDLDEHNGRYERTPEFPNGVYAYHVSLKSDGKNPAFPYFIGNTYRSLHVSQNANQSFDFNNSQLVRNTYPYKIGDKYANNDFIVESYESLVQTSIVDSVTKGSVDGFTINNSGTGYKVNDLASFDNTGTNGGGLSAHVSSVKGKTISSINTTVESYQSAVLVWENPNKVSVNILPSHTLNNGDNVAISGLSTFLPNLSKTHKIGVTTESTTLVTQLGNSSIVGFVTDIFVSNIPSSVVVDTTIGIGTETMTVLGTYPEKNVIRVLRDVGPSYDTDTVVNVSKNEFSITVKTDYFDSVNDDKIYFNQLQAIGVGRTSGLSVENDYYVGDRLTQVSVPVQSIYIPNHPFKNAQQVTFEKASTSNSISVSNESSSSLFSIPRSGNTDTLFVINKSKDYIGLCTNVGLTTNTDGLFFRSVSANNDSRDYRYSLSTDETQVTAKVEKVVSTITVAEDHDLKNGDIVNLTVKPNQSVGIGTSTSVFVKYNSSHDRLLIDPIGFSSLSVNSTSNTITLNKHGLKTTDKVFYDATDLLISGLSTGLYYVYRVDDNNINLSATKYDAESNPPSVVSFASTGGSSQQIFKVNPQIKVVRNNDLVFNVSDPTLEGYNFRIFYDNEFKNELVSIGSSTVFTTAGVGTVGVTTTATFTVKYNDNLPSKLYYQLEKGGFISTADKEVNNYSQILFTNSVYSGSYSISGIGSTTFNISLNSVPESSSYTQSNTNTLKYSTSSTSASGGVDSIKISFGGANYKKLPKFETISSSAGKDADISPISSSIGRINKVLIQDPGFDFSADKTLSPQAYISPKLTLKDNDQITSIDVVSGGSGYTSPPDLILVNTETKNPYSSGILESTISGSSISSVKIIETPRGLAESKTEVYALNNTNGVPIKTVQSSSSGIVTCILSTPVLGFTTITAPFKIGDEAFVEGITNYVTGDGFNSADNGYNFFTVSAYRNTNPAEVEFNISPYTSNPGLANTDQNSFATIINRNSYPSFTIVQSSSNFIIGEKLLTKSGNTYIERDLSVTDNVNNTIKVYGSYELSKNEILLGRDSGSIAKINTIDENEGRFVIDYNLLTDYGWGDDIGKLSEDYQVLPDNDYYQNLSYSIKSPIEYEDWVNPVNRLVHTTGLKNFSDTGITSEGKVSAGTTTSVSTALIDLISNNRVDTINIFDYGIDYEYITNKSKFVKLRTKKLSDYILCKSNRVLKIDDVSGSFNNTFNKQLTSSTIDDIITSSGYKRYLVQVVGVGTNTDERQLTEIIVLDSPKNNAIIIERGSVSSGYRSIGDIDVFKNSNTNTSVAFYPQNIYTADYDIKLLKNEFNTTLAGINTQSLGFVDLIGSNIQVNSGLSSVVYSKSTSNLESLFVNVEITDRTTKDKTVVEMFIDHDGTDTNTSEFFFDNNESTEFSNNFIGTFTSNINSGILSLNYENNISNDVLLRTKIVGFGTTASGIGTYRFKQLGQPDSSVRQARLESSYTTSSGITTLNSFSLTDVSSVKSTVKVSYGNTSALHQVLLTHNSENSFLVQYPFLSIGSTSGIGSFGSNIAGNFANLVFYPDSNFSGEYTVQVYNEIVQYESDLVNNPDVLAYGTVNEEVISTQYNGINGSRVAKYDFDLKHNNVSIFEKQFDPSVSLNTATGIFSIVDHFFNTGEKLTYTPRSTFEGESSSAMVMSDSSVLPSTVYAIKVNNREFKLATSLSNANSGIGVTFNSVGSGNGHTLEMTKKLEKSLITVDGLTQSPIAFTPISHNLFDNGGTVSAGTSYFSLSGISSIFSGDLLKIDNEYVKVESVGLGTTSIGPITSTGSFNLVQVERGFVGSSATSHSDSTEVRIYNGSYNIERSKIYFTEPPVGNPLSNVDENGLPVARSSFGGRVYLRQDYSTNRIFDDISRGFTGIGATYTLTVGGANTTGIETGSGLVYINSIFQPPITTNNTGGNYNFSSDSTSSRVVFTGIVDSNDDLVLSDYDVNQNQLPRGGMIVSLGSTSGLGFAPLVGAAVTAVISGGILQNPLGAGSTDNTGSGYYGNVSIGITDPNHNGSEATIEAIVGLGGTLAFNVTFGGSGYTDTARIIIPSPSYENLPIIGVSRLGIGATTDSGSGLLMNVTVGAANTNVGIGSTYYEVKEFKITRPGWGFKIGDKFKPVGLVTANNRYSPINDFELEVLDIFNDKFTGLQFGELDYIDSIRNLQNGTRTRFPLTYNGEILSFEIDPTESDSAEIDIENLLLVYINGVLQEPGVNYTFEGGTSIVFAEPPRAYSSDTQYSNDNIDIFFYMGTRDVDSQLITDINPSIETGDIIKLGDYKSISSQDDRIIYNIRNSDVVETDMYTGLGIDDTYRPFSWTKQKVDSSIGGELTYKTRDSLKSQVYPTAKVIGNFTSTDTDIFVDDVSLFNYEGGISADTTDALIVNTTIDPVSAAITATVSSSGTITLNLNDGGSGYTVAPTIKISSPATVGVGVGTTATATATISNGSVTSVTVTNPGLGYTTDAPPQVIVSLPSISHETVQNMTSVSGFNGTVVAITTAVGTGGNSLALEFTLNATSFNGLQAGYPILITGTSIGSGVVSIDNSDSDTVGIGTTFLDNVYIISSFHSSATTGVATCNVLSTSSVIGLTATGSATDPRGFFSWGKISGFTRSSSPISIGVTGLTVDSGLSTFPTIQRRGYGLRNNGSIRL